ncbi:MAG: DUF4363 family protein [Oscillospiraceae bacterium]|nr:DUF4363 family protein [Oscillospiraceae bacterium]
MRRLWLGVGLLLALLVLGVYTASGMQQIHSPVSKDLHRAAQAALDENWQEAEEFSKQAQSAWSRYWRITAAVADHEPMEEIDSLFAELKIYVREQEAEHFAACCANLSTLTRAMGEAHTINWWNLL